MKKTAKIIKFKEAVDFEDIICVLNPLQACDLKQILLMTNEDRRLAVALSFANLNHKELFNKSGLCQSEFIISRWLNYKTRLPMGAAFRLAKVLGVPAEILFQSPLWQRKKNDSE